MSLIKLAIVEDDATIRETVSMYLGRQPEIEIVQAAGSVEEFMYALKNLKELDLVILDIGLPGKSGLEGILDIHQARPEVDIIILSAFDDHERIYTALCGGAVAYLSKRTALPVIKEAVLTVFNGGSYMSPEIARKVIERMNPPARRRDPHFEELTDRQNQIVKGLVDGLSYKLIADKHDISVETVRDHIKKIYKKLHVNSKAEVIRKVLDGG